MSSTAEATLKRVEESFRMTPDKKASLSRRGMVATAFPDATCAGAEMLRRGGNAVDAACAASLALAVCEPQASGIGGQTIALIHVNGRTVAIDSSSRAPSLAHSSRFTMQQTRFLGYGASTAEVSGIRVSTILPPGAGDTMLLVLMILDNIPRKYVCPMAKVRRHLDL